MDGATQPARREKNQGGVQTNVEEGAGGLLLLAAAHETGLLCDLETAIAPCEPPTARSLLSSSPRCLRQLLLTLLFFPLGNLHRTHDLRSYTGNVLAVLTGRSRAYGYCHTERDLSPVGEGEWVRSADHRPWLPSRLICGKRASRMLERKLLPVCTSMATASPSMPTA